MAPYIITGVPSAGGSVAPEPPMRYEINDFVKIEDQFSLYIQAIQAMYDAQDSDPTSFFQVASIHGKPYVPWDNAPGGKHGPYCTHRSVLFPTWHRPYVALLEQVIQGHAVEIAKQYNSDSWTQAAANLRQPFWDWARGTGVPPDEVISMEQVTITTPNGQRMQVKNPLVYYTFKSKQASGALGSWYANWPKTLRSANSQAPDATTDLDQLKETLQQAQEGLAEDVVMLLTQTHDWPAFSHRRASDGTTTSSLEAIHDGVHVNVGQPYGHMTDTTVASFDPIFYMHHCNVDRMLALWTAMNPGVWVTDDKNPDGSTVDAQTPLMPFWNSPTTQWPSTNVVASTAFNYIYPEFQGVTGSTPDVIQAQVEQAIDELYNGAQGNFLAKPPAAQQAAAAPAPSAPAPEPSASASAPAPAAPVAAAADATEPPAPQPEEQNTAPDIKPVENVAARAPPKATEPTPETTDTKPAEPEKVAPPAAAQVPVAAPASEAVPKPVERTQVIAPTPVPASAPAQHPTSTPAAHPAAHPAHSTSAPKKVPYKSPAFNSNQWTARIRCNQHDITTSFKVMIFLGDPPHQPKDWHKSTRLVGSDDVFVNSDPEHCENCRSHTDEQTEGFVHLNKGILVHSPHKTLDPEHVLPYLEKALQWRVLKADGHTAPLPSLEVFVIMTPMVKAENARFPVAGRPKYYPKITFGKPGGARHD